MSHLIPTDTIETLMKGPSLQKTQQVAVLQNHIRDLLGSDYHAFLQGSYRNNTAPFDINDVDIVVVRKNTYSGQYAPRQTMETITWDSIFQEIEAKLARDSNYGWNIERRDKCIKLEGFFNADVIPAVVYEDPEEDPIAVFSFRDRKETLTRPRKHFDNGVKKHEATSQLYKPTVRMFKNWKQNHYGQEKSTVSSFKIETLVHGVENTYFVADAAMRFILVGENIIKRLNMHNLTGSCIISVCGGEDITVNWPWEARRNFIDQLARSVEQARQAYNATTKFMAEVYWNIAFNKGL